MATYVSTSFISPVTASTMENLPPEKSGAQVPFLQALWAIGWRFLGFLAKMTKMKVVAGHENPGSTEIRAHGIGGTEGGLTETPSVGVRETYPNIKIRNLTDQFKIPSMDIEVKYRIISEIINTNDERVLNAVKSIIIIRCC